MTRKILSVIAGLVTGFILIMLVETISHKIYPPPKVDFSNSEILKKLMHEAPVGALLLIVAAWAVGSFGGGMVATLVSKELKPVYALIVGALLTLAGLGNLLMLPHPAWMWVGLTVFIPFAFIGYQSALKIHHE